MITHYIYYTTLCKLCTHEFVSSLFVTKFCYCYIKTRIASSATQQREDEMYPRY